MLLHCVEGIAPKGDVQISLGTQRAIQYTYGFLGDVAPSVSYGAKDRFPMHSLFYSCRFPAMHMHVELCDWAELSESDI